MKLHPIRKVRSGDLLQDWPAQGRKGLRVAFSKYSRFYSFNCSSSYRSNMSYSSAEIKTFRVEALQEGLRIKNLVSSFPSNVGAVIDHLVKNDVLAEDELLGIEHLIGEEATERLMLKRHAHVALVLGAQKLLPKINIMTSAEVIAQIAAESSHRNVKKAHLRALLAVCD